MSKRYKFYICWNLIGPCVPYSPSIQLRYSSIDTALLCKILEKSDNYSWRYCIQRIGEYRNCRHKCSLGVYLVIDNLLYMYVPSDALPLYQILKQSVMEILHLKDLRDAYSVVMNAVVLVPGGCQIPMAMYLRGYLPICKVVLQCVGNWQCYATLKSSRTDRQTDTYAHTHTHTASIQ